MGLLDGLLMNDPLMDPRTQGLLSAGAAMLAQSGPSRMPHSLGSIAGQGLMAGMQGYGNAMQLQKQDVMTRLQMQNLVRQMEAQDAFQRMFGPQGQPSAAAGASAPQGGLSESSAASVGAPWAANEPAPQQAPQNAPKGPTLAQIGALGGLDPARAKFALQWYQQNRDEVAPKKEVSNGFAYDPRNVPTGFLPQVQVTPQGQAVSLTPGPNGGLPTVAALPGSLPTYSAFKDADELAKAKQTPFSLNMPGGRQQQVPLDMGMGILRQIMGTPEGGTVRGTAPNPAAAGTILGAAGMAGRTGAIGLSDSPAVQASDKTYAEKQAGGWVEREQVLRSSWNDANSMRSNLDLMEYLAQDPNVASGKLAEEISGLKSIADSFGIKTQGLKAEEAIKSIATELALKAKNQGGTNLMPGAMAIFETKLLQSMTPQLAQSADGRMLMIQVFKAKADRDMRISEMASEYVDKNGRLDNKFENQVRAFTKANPMFDEARAKAMEEYAKRLMSRK